MGVAVCFTVIFILRFGYHFWGNDNFSMISLLIFNYFDIFYLKKYYKLSRFIKVGVATYLFDVLRLMHKCKLGEVIIFQWFDSCSNVFAVKAVTSQYYYCQSS